MIDISLIKSLLSKANYDKYRDKLQVNDFSKDLQGIVRVIDVFFANDPDSNLNVDSLANLYFSDNRRDVEYFQGIFDNIKKNDSSDSSVSTLVDSLRRNRLLRELSLKAYEVTEGRGKYEEVFKLLEDLKSPEELGDEDPDDSFVTTDIVEILSTSRTLGGLRWRLDSLNKRLGSLRKGAFGFVFARPETGKTSFLASEVTHMASQIKDEDGPAIWFNNEQVATEVVLRWYQAVLEYNQVQLISNMKEAKNQYQKIIRDKLQMKDGAQIHWKQVEKICEKHKPSLIVFDQIDKIKGFDSDREDLRLGSIYIWARELAKEYCPVIGVCQASGAGENIQWLTMEHVANARTSKQAEADWILGIGKRNEPGYDNLRYMHLSKNKLWGDEDTDPKLRHDRWETLLDPEIARYKDLR